MTSLTIDDRTIELPKYNLKLMRVAAPAMDRVLKAAAQLEVGVADVGEGDGTMPSFQPLIAILSDMIEVVAVGASQVDEALDTAYLETKFGLPDMVALQSVFGGIMADAGIAAVTGATGAASSEAELVA